MELQFLGTGAGVPAKHRNVSSIALKLLDERNAVWLFDCGEGTQLQILKSNIRPRKIEKIFITHLHGDHIFGLPGLLSSRSFQGGNERLELYGPVGIASFVRTALKVSQTRLSYELKIIEIDKEGGTIFSDKQFSVSCLPLDHGIASFGFRIVEADHEGELQVEKLKALNIPSGPIYGKIKRGETVTLPDGQEINGKDFVGEQKKGRTVTILGDTRKTKNSVLLADHADILVHESTFNKEEEKMAKAYFHSTSHQAAQVALNANVEKLILTHISARYLTGDIIQLENEAKEIFQKTKIVKDMDIIDIPFKDEGDK
ncbi:ribonuclease Z [Enterococcus sp. DIV0242_7C1]|uniref:Ribonuclease Z n=1 Tax=Candidatus Enterococcus dunnyi TaxID=1834192 RepID=A0A200JE87_9ENTE|nr:MULTISPECIES: ribonuclease Z [unclassified Enterococcus]MBO0469199.1 ribonuclease Z [Enterococcus sp. DIV0242_7C1]MCA5012783.1 ribonuclease Z [Enterococcus sp. S23]MCA5016034.1 ribonuclease Z [Enterococcus sp. S22(2020)]OUZ35506.1 ribonuclease Z [Enterococcus sp. 9D6_DIV0238]